MHFNHLLHFLLMKQTLVLGDRKYFCGSTNKQIRGRKALEQGKCVVGVNFFG